MKIPKAIPVAANTNNKGCFGFMYSSNTVALTGFNLISIRLPCQSEKVGEKSDALYLQTLAYTVDSDANSLERSHPTDNFSTAP